MTVSVVETPGFQRGNVEIIGTGLCRDLKIGSLAVDADILSGDFRMHA